MAYKTEEFTGKAELFLNNTSQYVFLSSARVYAPSITPLKESSMRLLDTTTDNDYLNTDEYALAKARQENILRNSGKSNWTIIRPYITYSENRLQLGVQEKESWLYRVLKGRTLVVAKEILDKRTTLTYGFDVAKGIASLIGNDMAYNETYHITVNESYTWGEILETYLGVIEKHTEKKVKVLYMDKNPYHRGDSSYYQFIYDRRFNRTFDSSKIGGLIDTGTFTPTLIGIRSCIESFLSEPKFRNINWQNEARKDKIAKEFPKFNEFPNIRTMLKYYIYRLIKA